MIETVTDESGGVGAFKNMGRETYSWCVLAPLEGEKHNLLRVHYRPQPFRRNGVPVPGTKNWHSDGGLAIEFGPLALYFNRDHSRWLRDAITEVIKVGET